MKKTLDDEPRYASFILTIFEQFVYWNIYKTSLHNQSQNSANYGGTLNQYLGVKMAASFMGVSDDLELITVFYGQFQ